MIWLHDYDDWDPEYEDGYVTCPTICDTCRTPCDRRLHFDGSHEHAIDEVGVPEGYVHRWTTEACRQCGDPYCTGCRWPVDVKLAPDYEPLF